jgi:hypothetical protein
MATGQPAHADHCLPYPRGVPAKFSPEGAVQPFAGNTIVCHLRRRPGPDEIGSAGGSSSGTGCPMRAALDTLYSRLAAHPFATTGAPEGGPLYTLLPPASWHVTLFEGVCDQVRGQQGQSGDGVYCEYFHLLITFKLGIPALVVGSFCLSWFPCMPQLSGRETWW